jgi:hypothetical protein
MKVSNAEIWFAKLDPARPNAKFNKQNPTWECQIRTQSKDVKKEWEAMNLPVKAILPDEGTPYWRVNLRKKSIKVDKSPASPITVVNGKLEPVDPNSIGNGSIVNIRLFQYDYTKKDGTPGVVSVLMGIQLVKHIVYKAKPREDEFDMGETETIDAPDPDEAEVAASSSPKVF